METGEVKRAAVVGAGSMGHSIAQVFAQAGIEAWLVDVDENILQGARETLADAGRMAGEEIGDPLGRVHATTDLASAASQADFVVEAVPEVPEVKKEVFARLGEACPAEAIIASNTSGLDIFEFAEVEGPERLLIAHWFLPPHIIPLVEVVPGPLTSPRAVEFTAALMRRLGKEPVVMGGFTRAFIVNKIQNMIALAVFELLGSGLVEPRDIDRAVKYSLGIRLPVVGVAQNLDFNGLDLVLDVGKSYGFRNPFIEGLVAAGRLGVKTSRGIYDYGGRSETEIVAKRDRKFLDLLAFLREIEAFDPV